MGRGGWRLVWVGMVGVVGGGEVVGWEYELFFGLVEVVFVQDVGVRKDVAQEPAQCGFAARGTAADADDRCFPLVAGHQVGLLGEVGVAWMLFPEGG